MADAFRGLTIRLGADARPLNSAINSIARSAGQAQQQMSRLSKALKFNPGNTQALARMVDLAGDKAMHSARQVQTLKTALDQAARESKELFRNSASYKNSNIEKLASSITDVYAKTQKLRAEGNHITAELQHIYDAAKRAASVDMGISWKKADKYVKGLQRNLSMGGAAADRATAKLTELFSKVSAKDGIFDMFGLAAGDVQKLTEKFFSLRSAFKMTESDLKAMNKVEGFRAIENQIVAAKSELREAAAEAARLKTEFYAFGANGDIAKVVSDTKRLDSVMEKAVSEAEEMKAAFKALPGSMEAARAKSKSLADAEDVIRQKLLSVRDAMHTISSVEGFDRMKASTVNATSEVERLESEFAELKADEMKAAAAAETVENQLKEINNLTFGKPKESIDDLREALKLVGITSKEALADPIATLNKLEDESRDAAGAVETIRTAMNKVEGEMREMGAYKTFQSLEKDALGLKAKLSNINFQKSIFSKLGGIGQTFRQFGYGMYSTVTPALMMVGRYAIQTADQIDSSYRNMRKTVNGTEEQFEHLKNAAVEYSRTHVTSADQILEIEAIGGQLGITADNLEAFATTVSNLDIATNMDTEDIALDLAKMSNIMHFGQESYDSFADALVRLGNNEPALESDIMKISTRFAGMAANVGMTTADMLGFATAATATGQKAEAAGGSMQRTIGRIEKAVAANGDDLKAYAKVSGMSAQEFARSWEDVENHGPAKVMQAFIEGLHDVNANGGSVTKTLDELGITGVRDVQLLEGLSNITNVLAESLGMSNDAWNGLSTTMKDGAVEQAGDAAREAGRKSEGFSGELAKMKNNAAALAIELGEGAAPFVKDLGAILKDATGWFKDLSPEFKQFAVGAMGITAAIGPMSVGLGTFTSAIGHAHSALATVGGKFTEWGARFSKADFIGPLTRGMKAANGFSKALSALGTFKGMAAIAGIIVALNVISGKIQENAERLETFRKATEGIREGAKKVRESTKWISDGFDTSDKSIYDFSHRTGAVAEDVSALTSKGAELASTIDEKLNSALSDAAMAELYGEKITELANNCGGSSEKLEELKTYVEKYNEVTGSSIGVTDDFSGALSTSTEALEKNTEAFQANTMMKAYSEVVGDATKHLAELNVEQQKLEGKQKELMESTFAGMDQGTVTGLARDYVGANGEEAASAAREAVTGWSEAEQAALSYYAELQQGIDALTPQQQAARESQAAAIDAYKQSVFEAKNLTHEQEAIAEKTTNAAAYYEQLGDKGKQAFGTIKSACGFAKDEGDKFGEALATAGISADLLGRTGTKAFMGFLEQAQSATTDVPTQLSMIEDGLRAVDNFGISPKEITVTDNGAIMEFEGHIVNLSNMTIDDKQFEVTSDGLEFTEEQTVMLEGTLNRLNSMRAEPKVELGGDAASQASGILGTFQSMFGSGMNMMITATADTSAATNELSALQSAADAATQPKTAVVNGDTSDAQSKFDTIKNYYFPAKSASVNYSGNAISSLSTISSQLNSLDGKTANTYTYNHVITVRETRDKTATGAIFNSRGKIPLNAAGAINGIVSHAMLTNIGWVGEAGAEAVMHMRNAGGAVIPLSNRKYVRPFAHAVAAEMGGGGGGSTVVNNYSINGLSVPEGSDAADALKALYDALRV